MESAAFEYLAAGGDIGIWLVVYGCGVLINASPFWKSVAADKLAVQQ